MSEPPLPKTPTAAAAGPAQGELPQTLGECHAVLDLLRSQLGQLQEQVMTLQERLKLDSSNSSKPPSSDGPGSGNRAQCRASTRKRGAQKGHKGHYRALPDEQEVQQITDCKPTEVWYAFRGWVSSPEPRRPDLTTSPCGRCAYPEGAWSGSKLGGVVLSMKATTG